MRAKAVLAALVVLVVAPAAIAVEDLTIKNAGLARTISNFGGPLRTTKLEANGVQILQQPGVEFMIDLDYKGEPVSLAPVDFQVKSAETAKVGTALRTSLRMQCMRDGLPLVIYVRYHRDPLASYQQKSITVEPCKKAAGAILRRIILDDQALKPEYVPVMPTPRGAPDPTKQRFALEGPSDFAAIDRDSQRGLFFFVTSLIGREAVGRTGSVRMWEEMYAPVEKGYETGRATIGAVKGPPEILFKRFREFLWENYCVARGRPLPLAGSGALWDKADLLAGSLPKEVAAGKATVVGLRGDDWPVAKPGANEAAFAALTACIDACRKLRAANREVVLEVLCGLVPHIPKYASGLAEEFCPGVTRVHWLGVADRIGIGWGPDRHHVSGRQERYDQAFILPPATFRAAASFSLSANGQVALPKELAAYLAVYQHILGYPDGKSVDGEGHIIANKGFIILFNPSDEARKLAVPLDEPELELKGALRLTDWTQPGLPADLGTVRVGERFEVEIAASGVRVIGVNLQQGAAVPKFR